MNKITCQTFSRAREFILGFSSGKQPCKITIIVADIREIRGKEKLYSFARFTKLREYGAGIGTQSYLIMELLVFVDPGLSETSML